MQNQNKAKSGIVNKNSVLSRGESRPGGVARPIFVNREDLGTISPYPPVFTPKTQYFTYLPISPVEYLICICGNLGGSEKKFSEKSEN